MYEIRSVPNVMALVAALALLPSCPIQAAGPGEWPAITSVLSNPGSTIAVDSQHNVYTVGPTSANLPVTPGAPYANRTTTSAWSYLMKVDAQGRVIYGTYIPGFDYAIAVNAAGEAVVAGMSSKGISITRINAAGNALISSTSFDQSGAGGTWVSAVALDPQGNIYIAGTTGDPYFPTTPGSLRPKFTPNEANTYLVKLDPFGSKILYSTFLSAGIDWVGAEVPPCCGGDSQYQGGLAVDQAGNAYVAGCTTDPSFPVTPGALNSADHGSFVIKINTVGGGLVFGSRPGAYGCATIALDNSGAIYAAAGLSLMKLSPDGQSFLYSIKLPALAATVPVLATSLAVDPDGNTLVGGYISSFFNSDTLPGTALGPSLHPVMIGSASRFCLVPFQYVCSVGYLSKVDPNGNFLWSTYMGVFTLASSLSTPRVPTAVASVSSVAFDSTGNALVAGNGLPASPPANIPSLTPTSYYLAKIEPVGPPPLISPPGVVNAASYVAGSAPGGLVSVFGTGLSDAAGIVTANSNPLPTALAGASIDFSGTLVPMLAAANVGGQEQINFQVPFEQASSPTLLNGSPYLITVKRGRLLGFAANFQTTFQSPGIFTLSDGTAAILHADYSLVSASSPAHAGETILIYATGLGWVDPPVPTGTPAPVSPLSATVPTPIVMIGGAASNVQFSGLAPGFAGLYQLNVTIPKIPAGTADLYIQRRSFNVGEIQTSQHVSIPIQ